MRKAAGRKVRRSMSKRAAFSAEEASKIVKRLAAKQKIRVRLTEEQLAAITNQWKGMNPKKPAEITFYIQNRGKVGLKVASQSYWNNSCCV
ncbi:MAG: hypothetical protein ACREBU_03155 [Nitrososphaera sp.]